MRHIFSVQRQDGTYAEVGMTDRWIRIGITRRSALIQARMASRQHHAPVRVESWEGGEFYKPEARPIVTIVGPYV